MQENTNRAIAYNSIILYFRMIITTICALLTTRFALQALGFVDFGLYSVLGGIISLISIFNIIMLTTSNRFIAVAIGKGNIKEANKQFNVNLYIHVAIACFALLVAYPLGEWYIPRFVNYDGSLHNAMMVYNISIIGSIISFIAVPYNGLLMAKERFIVFSSVDVISHVAKLVVALILVYFFNNKLLIYTITMAILTAMPLFVYFVYCNNNYREIVKLRLVTDWQMYKGVFNFSAWVGFGALATVGKGQGASLLVNAFFNTVMNTAMGVAASINSYVTLFAQNATQPIAPQITKSYAAGNTSRTDELLIMSTKYSYLLTLLVGSVFLIAPEWILRIWLGDVPPYSTVFLRLFVVDNLVLSLNSGISNIIFASGKIYLYQIASSTLNILSVVLGFLVLRLGTPAYYLLIVYVAVSVVRYFVIQWTLRRTLQYDTGILWRKSYIPSLLTTLLFLPVLLIPDFDYVFIKLLLSLIYLCLIEWFVGLNREERARVFLFIKNKKMDI